MYNLRIYTCTNLYTERQRHADINTIHSLLSSGVATVIIKLSFDESGDHCRYKMSTAVNSYDPKITSNFINFNKSPITQRLLWLALETVKYMNEWKFLAVMIIKIVAELFTLLICTCHRYFCT